MKIKTTLLIAGVLSAFSVAATPMTPNEIFSAIDAEYNHLQDDNLRVNFELSAVQDSSVLLNQVLSGIDGEGQHTAESQTRVNYSMDSMDSDKTGFLNDILSAIDAEGDY